MFSRIFYGSSQYALMFIASFFVSLFMLTSLSPVNAFEGDYQKGQGDYIIEEEMGWRDVKKVAWWRDKTKWAPLGQPFDYSPPLNMDKKFQRYYKGSDY